MYINTRKMNVKRRQIYIKRRNIYIIGVTVMSIKVGLYLLGHVHNYRSHFEGF